METDLSRLPMLVRREIEARIAGPLIRGFARDLGEEKALEIARKVVNELAQESGLQLAAGLGGNSVADFGRGLAAWSAGGALDVEMLEQTEDRLRWNVTRCRYADMYRELDLADLGDVLSCGRDFFLVEGFNPELKLLRTTTIMAGGDHCDFCLVRKEKIV